jgi:hypothetical protein
VTILLLIVGFSYINCKYVIHYPKLEIYKYNEMEVNIGIFPRCSGRIGLQESAEPSKKNMKMINPDKYENKWSEK